MRSPFVILSKRSLFVILSKRSPFVILSKQSPFVILSKRSLFVILSKQSPFVILSKAQSAASKDLKCHIGHSEVFSVDSICAARVPPTCAGRFTYRSMPIFSSSSSTVISRDEDNEPGAL